jgi:putative transposase
MPRKPRFFLSGVPLHIVQRGHSRDPVFFEDQDYITYAYWLSEASIRYQVSIHAYVLMTNHVHLLITPADASSVSLFMQFVGRHYVPYINHKYGRSGSIWDGRFRSSLVDSEHYLLATMRYIELNPVRASMVEHPVQYRWSSFCHNVGVNVISMIEYHPVFLRLGNTSDERFEVYKGLFMSQLDDDTLQLITDSWATGTPLGNDYFRDKVEAILARKVGQSYRGRPKRALTR